MITLRIAAVLCPFTLLIAAGPPPFKVRQGTTITELPLERYVAGVLAGESSVFRSDEALKAMAVAARTYAVRLRGRHAAEGFDFCVTTHCQRLDLTAITPRIESMVAATAGELLWFEGKPAFACYSRDCGGKAEDVAAVWPDLRAPYLKSHEDPYCVRAGNSTWQWSADPLQIAEALRRSQLRTPRAVERIGITERTPSGRAATLSLTGAGESIAISAGSLRFALGRELDWNTVRSDRYEVQTAGGRVVFTGSGSGHGVGLCQVGADQMGREGRRYQEILAFYFPGTLVGLTGRGLPWQRLTSENLSLMTTEPDIDRGLLGVAEKLLRTSAQRTGLAPPSGIELRVYPDLDTFRNATGEPGWVAAHTEGRRIHLQPASVLRNRGALESTLRHELLHVILEAHAAASTPVWFREGLVGYFAGAVPAGAGRAPSETDMRQTGDPARARRAYADAVRAVADLVKRYGEARVLAWLGTSLPEDVRRTSTSQAPTNSR